MVEDWEDVVLAAPVSELPKLVVGAEKLPSVTDEDRLVEVSGKNKPRAAELVNDDDTLELGELESVEEVMLVVIVAFGTS
jgi:hypothetical protein